MLATIPCDLSIQSYCNLPGAQYPWHAVRRFVHENQGLMRRMYGDVRHISILRTEINNNDIELDDVVKTATRYSRSGWKKNKYLYASDFQNSKTNDVLTEPHFRPASSSTTTPTTTTTTTTVTPQSTTTTSETTTSATPSLANTTVKTTTQSLQHQSESNFRADTETESESTSVVTSNTKVHTNNLNDVANSVFENITQQSTVSSFTENEPIRIVQSPNLAHNRSDAETATISTTLRIFLPSAKVAEPSITPPQDDDATTTASALLVDDEIKFSDHTTEHRDDSTINDNAPQPNDFDGKNNFHITGSTSKQSNKNVRPTEHTEGQLFQDAVDKEVPVTNNRGV